MSECTHRAITAWKAEDGEPVDFWSCADCGRRFEPLNDAKGGQPSAEPVAWMHDDPKRVDVIRESVRKLLRDSADSAGHLHRPLDKSERYTIPLYAHPPAAEIEALRQLLADIKAWDIENFALDVPLPLRRRIEAAIAQQEAP